MDALWPGLYEVNIILSQHTVNTDIVSVPHANTAKKYELSIFTSFYSFLNAT